MNVSSEIRPYLFLGSAAVRTSKYLKTAGITLVINATNQCPMSKRCCVRQIELDCDDAPDYDLKQHFKEVGVHIRAEREEGGRVFVHCIGGISRSPTLVLAYLMEHENMNLQEAYDLVQGVRSFIRPNVGFWRQLVEFEYELYGTNSVTMMLFGEKVVASVYQSEYGGRLTP